MAEANAMHEHDDDDFQQVDAGASTTYPQQCSALRKNGYVMLKSRPCKIMEMSTSKTGKHGHAKVNLVGIDIFTGKRHEDMCPSTHNMEVPNVKRVEYSVLNVDKDDYVTLMDDSSNTREDLKLPVGELGDEIRTKFENGDAIKVTVLQALGEEAIITCKLENESKK